MKIMLEVATSHPISIACSPASECQDADLVHIQHYLEQYFLAHELSVTTMADLDVLLDMSQLGERNAAADSGSRTWTADLICPLRLYHAVVLLGPLYQPATGHGPCPLCLERSWQALRIQEEQEALYDLQKVFVSGPNPRLTPFALEMIGQATEMVLSQLLPAASSEFEGSYVYMLDLDSFKIERSPLIADTLCPVCARPEHDSPEKAVIHLTSQQKPEIDAYHVCKATDYQLPVVGYVNPVCGMLGSRSYQDHEHTVTSPVSGHFWIKGRYGLHKGWWGGHGNSYGSSHSLALLEGLERHAGFRPRTKSVEIFDSYEHLAPDALDPRECGLHRPEVYATMPYFTPFRPDLQTHWVWGYSLRRARPILVPEQLVYYLDYRGGLAQDRFVMDNSNGCASGSTLEEAILFGLLELIERDTFLLSWYTRLSPPRIDPWSSHNQQTLYLLDRIDRLGYDLHLLDTRLDLPIPTVVGLAVRREDQAGKLILAAGASLDPEDAIRATLCEVGAYISGIEERLQKKITEVRAMLQDFTLVTSIEQHPLLYALPEMMPHANFLLQNPSIRSVDETYADWHQQVPRSLDLLDDLQYCLDAIMALGLDVIVVDQTSPQQERVGLKTACVIIPGLLPISFGFYRERALDLPRLRTVPRSAGYLKTDFDPALINTTPHPFP